MNIRNRKTPRAKWHDYNGAEYFVTICTNNREHYFGEIHDGKMQLSVVGEYTQQCVRKIEEINSDVKVPLFVIMPNHIHLIVFIDGVRENTGNIVGLSYYGSRDGNDERLPQCDSPTTSKDGLNIEMQRRAICCGRLSYVIGRFKSSVTKFARQNGIPFVWQSRYHDHIIRNQDEKNKIGIYIEQNPLRWEYDCFYKND